MKKITLRLIIPIVLTSALLLFNYYTTEHHSLWEFLSSSNVIGISIGVIVGIAVSGFFAEREVE